MTTYPLEFHRRSEQKWILRAQASSARESTRQAALVGSSQRGQRRSGQPERRDILARSPWLREIGQWLRAGYDAAAEPVPERVCTENLIRIDCVTESPNVNGDDRALLPLPDPRAATPPHRRARR